MGLKTLLSECTKYDFKLILEEKNANVFAPTYSQNVGDNDGDVSKIKYLERHLI